jgi:hypothetical protein
MAPSARELALTYLDAVGRRDFAAVETLLAPDIRATGPAATRTSARDLIQAMKQLSAVHVRSDVRHLFVDGNDVCMIYDFITDTLAGVFPMVEWLHFKDGRIQTIFLFYDQLPWHVALGELRRGHSQPRG